MKANHNKLEFMINIGSRTLKIGDITIKVTSLIRLLGITTDSKLGFKKNINNIVKNII